MGLYQSKIGFAHRVQRLAGACVVAMCMVAGAAQAQVDRFVGSYEGSANVMAADGTAIPRDMSVEIASTKQGFTVSWTSVTYRKNGTSKEKSYTIDFEPSDRSGIFAAAMKRNVFGHNVQMDPMRGEPYVWARIEGDTLSVFSIFVTEAGGYDIQQYDRTLADGGLQLDFRSLTDGAVKREVSTFLTRK